MDVAWAAAIALISSSVVTSIGSIIVALIQSRKIDTKIDKADSRGKTDKEIRSQKEEEG